jgi:hypothetical protein
MVDSSGQAKLYIQAGEELCTKGHTFMQSPVLASHIQTVQSLDPAIRMLPATTPCTHISASHAPLASGITNMAEVGWDVA